MFPSSGESRTGLRREKGHKNIEAVIENIEAILSSDSRDFLNEVFCALDGLPSEFLLDTRLQALAKKTLIKAVSLDFSVDYSFVSALSPVSVIRTIKKQFHTSLDIVDFEVIEAAKAGLEKIIKLFTENKSTILALLFLESIEQYSKEFNLVPRDLTLKEQQAIKPVLIEAAGFGYYNTLETFFRLFQVHDLDEPTQNEVENADKEVLNKKELRRQVFEQREKMAQVAVSLDLFADFESQEGFDSRVSRAVKGAKGLSPKIGEAIENVGNEYASRWAETSTTFDKLSRRFFPDGSCDSYKLGFAYYLSVVGEKPVGEVAMNHKEMFIVLTFTKKEDYDRFAKVKLGRDEEAEPSGGLYCDSLTLILENSEEDSCAFVLVDGSEDVDFDRVMAHERHHAINAVIDLGQQEKNSHKDKMFHLFRPSQFQEKGTQWALEDIAKATLRREYKISSHYYERIKDEITAYLAEGTPPHRIPGILQKPTYRRLFANFDLELASRVRVTIQDICQQLESMVNLDPHDLDAGKKLAYHLVDLNFYEIVDYLLELQRYRRKKLSGR